MQQTLLNGAKVFGLSLSQTQLDAFDLYAKTLIEWNQKVNLTRIIQPEDIVIKHFLDSLSVVQVLPQPTATFSLIDVGTGPGFPGLPLKIILPQIRLTLLESTKKKTNFLQYVVQTLQLANVIVLPHRAEDAGQQNQHRERYNVAVARAVSTLPVLAEYTLPFVKVDGLMVAQKGQYPTDEIKVAPKALKILGGVMQEIRPISVPKLAAERHLIVIKKIKKTPKPYPRRPGLPKKDPLS